MSKVKDLPSKTTVADDDLIYVVDDAVGTNGGRKVKKSDFEASLNTINHSDRHIAGGADELPTGTPSTIGETNTLGVIPAFVKQDHVHAHGNQTLPTHHAEVVAAGNNGFMSGADKTKLDGIEVGATSGGGSEEATAVASTPTITNKASGLVTVDSMSITPVAGRHSLNFSSQYSISATGVTSLAKADLDSLVIDLEALPIAGGTRGLVFGTEVINAGVYDIAGASTGTASATLTLDGQSDPDALFVFRISTTFTIGASFTINLINQANPNNVFFLIGTGVTVATGSVLQGNFIGKTTLAITTSTLLGRIASTAGALTPTTLTINEPPLESTTQVLGIFGSFALFSGAGAVTNSGISVINGDVGTDVGSVTGFTTSTINGSTYSSVSKGATVGIGIYIDGVLEINSGRVIIRESNVGGDYISLFSMITTTLGQVVDVRIQAHIGSITVGNRSVTSLKVG
jgi:hypothetical protein